MVGFGPGEAAEKSFDRGFDLPYLENDADNDTRVVFGESADTERTAEGAVSLPELPERKFVSVSDTATYKLFKNVSRFRVGSVFTVLIVIACVVLGLVCVIRYASIFDLTRHTRILENQNAKDRNKLAYELSNVETGETASVDSIAAKLGMVRPSDETSIRIPLSGGDVTRVFLGSEETPQEGDGDGFYESLWRFLGRIKND